MADINPIIERDTEALNTRLATVEDLTSLKTLVTGTGSTYKAKLNSLYATYSALGYKRYKTVLRIGNGLFYLSAVNAGSFMRCGCNASQGSVSFVTISNGSSTYYAAVMKATGTTITNYTDSDASSTVVSLIYTG